MLTAAFATAADAASLTLEWDPPTDSSTVGYLVYYGTSSRTYTTHYDVGFVTTHRVDGLLEGTTYCFVVRAYNKAGDLSPSSTEVCGSTAASGGNSGPGSPNAPGQSTVTSATANGDILNLTWIAGQSGMAPTSHRLEFFAQSTPVAVVNVGAATKVALRVPPGTEGSFTVRVTPFNDSTAGPPSMPFAFTIGGASGECTSPPAAPLPTGTIVSGMATVRWPAVPGATSYIVSAGLAPHDTSLYPPTSVGATTTVRASGLPAGFTAWVRVLAVNACGQGAPGDFFLSSGTAEQR